MLLLRLFLLLRLPKDYSKSKVNSLMEFLKLEIAPSLLLYSLDLPPFELAWSKKDCKVQNQMLKKQSEVV